jgi:putative ABC transport system permease protein
VVRVAGPALPRVRGVAKAIASVDPRISVSGAVAAEEIVERTIGASRGRTTFLSVVGILALALAVSGVYGLTSYTTELRARELAIRVALGAHGRNLFRVISGELWWMAALAVVVAALASMQLVAFLDSIYRPSLMRSALVRLPIGPLAASGVTLVLVMALAVSVPLRRVLRLDVMRTVQGS